jgi:hypothetical protein
VEGMACAMERWGVNVVSEAGNVLWLVWLY